MGDDDVTHTNILAAQEQLARDRLRLSPAALVERLGADPVKERTKEGNAVEQAEALAFLGEALVALAGDLDELTAARAATKGAR